MIINEGLSDITLDGLTIDGGHTERTADTGENTNNGGGILSLGASFTVKNCIFLENSAGNAGGAIFLDPSPEIALIIENCSFLENGADFRGAGLFVLTPRASVTIKDSQFDEGVARFGAGVHFVGDNSILNIDNCQFTNGFTTGFSGALNVLLAAEVTIRNSTFSDNSVFQNGGAIVFEDAGTVLIENCTISGNEATSGSPDGRGGGLYILNGSDPINGTTVTMNNCNILNNKSSLIGGGVYVQGATVTINESFISGNTAESGGAGIICLLGGNLTVNNSTISENTTTDGHGGGVYLQDEGNYALMGNTFGKNISSANGGGLYLDDAGTFTITNCQFLDNTCEDSGGGIYLQETNIQVENTQFSKNKANWGGGISNSFEGAMATVTNCTFTENEAVANGGGLEAYGEAAYIVDQSAFNKNKAAYGGGINLELEGTSLTLMNSTFEENEVSVQGGALGLFNGTISKVYTTSFLRNIANRNGGAVSVSAEEIVTEPQIFDACIFDGNQSFKNEEGFGGYGGALISFNTNAQISNCLFVNNSCVSGGTISANDSDENQDIMQLTNCTFANNSDAGTASIYAWEDGSGDNVNLVLQNNIFGDTETGFKNEEGEAKVTSNGGNLCLNATMSEVLNHAKDQHSTSPNFKDATNDFRLASNSSGINAGINENAPAKDLAGFDRDGLVDIGAYESQEVTSLFEKIQEAGQVTIYPNPVQNNLQFRLKSDWIADFKVSIINLKGQTIWENIAFKTTETFQKTIEVAALPAAPYFLRIQKNEQESSQLFIKK